MKKNYITSGISSHTTFVSTTAVSNDGENTPRRAEHD